MSQLPENKNTALPHNNIRNPRYYAYKTAGGRQNRAVQLIKDDLTCEEDNLPVQTDTFHWVDWRTNKEQDSLTSWQRPRRWTPVLLRHFWYTWPPPWSPCSLLPSHLTKTQTREDLVRRPWSFLWSVCEKFNQPEIQQNSDAHLRTPLCQWSGGASAPFCSRPSRLPEENRIFSRAHSQKTKSSGYLIMVLEVWNCFRKKKNNSLYVSIWKRKKILNYSS